MRLRTVRAIYRKEMKETIRDRRTLVLMIVVPVLAIPLLMMFSTHLMISQFKRVAEETSRVAVMGAEHLPEELGRNLGEAEGLSLETRAALSDRDSTAWMKALDEGELDVVLIVPPGFERALLDESPTKIEIAYDKAEIRSDMAADKVSGLLESYRDDVVRDRLRQRDIPEEVILPFESVLRNMASARKLAGQSIGGLLPYLIILMCFTGAMYPAIDLAAGEKERGTLETLLVSPASRGEFVIGKYLVVLTTGIIAAALSLASLLAWVKYMAGIMGGAGEEETLVGLQFDPATVGLILLMMLPTAAIFGGVLLSISVFARSFKEAQNYITAFMMIILFPAFVSLVPGIKLSHRMALIPIVNVSLTIKTALSGTLEWSYAATAGLSMAVLAALILLFVKKWFERESVLFRM
ncbi:MAG: ABC transporter permease [Candidatus Eisenbacteria sp.]|nr:ABC transporter permease [Candidatus Eisenbacteria bacterium]